MTCGVFSKCGGCSAQHIEYEQQVEYKKKALAKAIGNASDIIVFPGEPFFYRNRMDFIFHEKGLGLREKGRWNRIVDVDLCQISDQRINRQLSEIREYFKGVDYYDNKKRSGTFKYAVIRVATESSVSIVLNSNSSRLKEAVQKVKDFSAVSSVENVIVTYTDCDSNISDDYFAVKGTDMLKVSYLGRQFYYSVQGFFQNNHGMAERMHEYCRSVLKKHDTRNSVLLDLYAGVGTFGIINADMFKSVLIVENDTNCIKAAKSNVEMNNIQNASVLQMDAIRLKLGLKSDIVIADPPRSGMHLKTINYLNEIKPRIIIYISCNVQQLEKDLKHLKGKVVSAALFDLFPQTPHSEAVVEISN